MIDQYSTQLIEDLDGEEANEPRPPNRKFKIKGEIFEAAGECPAGALFDMAAMAAKGEGDAKNDSDAAERIAAIPRFLDAVIMPESAERFAAMMRDPKNPLTMKDVQKVVAALVKGYSGGRPLEQSSVSSDGPPATGPSSMGGAQLVVSTPAA